MKRLIWLPRAALCFVACGLAAVVAGSLARVASQIEYSDEPVISEWSIESKDPMPDSMKSIVGEGPGTSLERVLIVKQNFYRPFGDKPPRLATTRVTCWKVVDPELQTDIFKNSRAPNSYNSWLEDTYQYRRFKPKWWPADLRPFRPYERKFQTSDSQFVSLSDRTRLYRR
jgi:hypothetical protein